MIGVDTNILVHAHHPNSPLHRRAAARLRGLGSGPEGWAIPVFCLAEFLRVVTHPRVLEDPLSLDEACSAVSQLLKSPSLSVLLPTQRFLPLFFAALEQSRAVGNRVFDAQIVAVCREAGVHRLLTEDRDFSRFEGFLTERL